MNIIATAVARPVSIAMATLAVALFGGLSLDRLGLSLLPELAYPTLTVRTDFEGAAPAEVEEQVTRRLEERLGVINGLRRMHSISAAERSDVVLEFAWGMDMTNASVEVREKLDLVQLPLDIERPSILRLNPNLDPIVRAAIVLKDGGDDEVSDDTGSDAARLQELRRFAEDVVKKRLDPVLGVAAVLVSGGFEDEIAVDVDQERLAQLDISVQQLGARLQAANINLSGGRLTARGQEFLVRTVNEFESVADIADTIVFQQQGRVLRLKDVATVSESHKERDSVMRVDGQEAIEIAMYKEGDANTVTVSAAIDERMAAIAAELPGDYALVKIYDQADFITAAIDEVRYAALIGALFAVIVLYLFLKHVRSTLIVTATIPVSVLATFVLMDVFDITLNIMSLGGIALAVGMLMDNAIVVLENIARHRNDPADVAGRRGATGYPGNGRRRARLDHDDRCGVSAPGLRRRHCRAAVPGPGTHRDLRPARLAGACVHAHPHAVGSRLPPVGTPPTRPRCPRTRFPPVGEPQSGRRCASQRGAPWCPGVGLAGRSHSCSAPSSGHSTRCTTACSRGSTSCCAQRSGSGR